MAQRFLIFAAMAVVGLSATVQARIQMNDATSRPAAIVAEIDPIEFFNRLMDRYRALSEYEDLAMVRRVLERGDAPPVEQGSRVGCVIRGGELDVTTPGLQWWNQFGLDVPRFGGDAVQAQRRAYRLWLAPHMALSRSTNEESAPPSDGEHRTIDSSDLAAHSVETLTVGDRKMIHLELATRVDEGEVPTTRLDLYVDLERMLIERMESEQHLDSGETLRTLVTIETKSIEPATAEGASTLPGVPGIEPMIEPVIEPMIEPVLEPVLEPSREPGAVEDTPDAPVHDPLDPHPSAPRTTAP